MNGLDIFMQIIGYIGAIGIAIASSPELIRCFKNKSTSNVNVPLFLLLMSSSLCFLVSGFYNISVSINNGMSASEYSFQLAVSIANIFSLLFPLIILIYKLFNYIKAKKLGITEKEYENRNNKIKN